MLRLSLNSRVPPSTASSGELDLVAASQRGDISAFNQLVRSYQELVYRFAFHVLDDAEAADRTTQTAFESAYQQIRTCNGEAFKTWMLRLAIRQCKREARVGALTANSFAQSPIEIGLAILSPDERIICVLADVLDLNDEDIARITNASVSAIRAGRGARGGKSAMFYSSIARQGATKPWQ